jgi:F-type H+-transporting ATPase subunit a
MPHIEIAAEKLFYFFGLPITNALVTGWIVAGIFLIVARALAGRVALLPVGLQNVFEFAVERFLALMEGIFGSREKAERHLPIVATLFLFILTSNWLGIVPGVGSIGIFKEERGEVRFLPLLRSAASDLNLTLALAFIAVFAVHAAGIRQLGLGAHLSKFFSFKNPIDFFVGILELVSEFAKMVSFSMRLFGNIFAGEVLLIITGFLAPYGAPIPFLGLEIFVGFVQALVFAMLTTVFISIAVAEH